MKISDLHPDELRTARLELSLARQRLISMAFGDLEQYYLDQSDLLAHVIAFLDTCLQEGVKNAI